jgi:hypothetical protein
MSLRIVTADERLREAQGKTTMALFGPSGAGKTTLLKTLPVEETVCLDLEAGLKSVQDWRGDSLPIRRFADAVDIACLIGGANPAAQPDEHFSEAHHAHLRGQHPELAARLDAKRIVFVDSITDLTRQAMAWAKTRPEALSERTGKPDTRGAYGLLAREVIGLPLGRGGQHDMVELVGVLVGGVAVRLDLDLRDERDPVEIGEPAQHALRLGRLAHVLRVQAERAVDHGPELALGDLPADRLALFVELAPLHGEVLPELAPGMRSLGHSELGVEHQHVAAGLVRRLQQPAIHLARPVRAALADGHGHFGEGAVGDQVAGLLRRHVVHVEGHLVHPFGAWLILERSAPRSAGSVRSRRPERSFAGRPHGLPERQTRRRVAPFSGSCRQAVAPSGPVSGLKRPRVITWSTMPGSSRAALPPSICGCQMVRFISSVIRSRMPTKITVRPGACWRCLRRR